MKRPTTALKGRIAAGAAVTAALIVPLAVFGGPALAGSSTAASAQYQYQVTICHMTGSKKHPAHTIHVAAAAVQAHLKHGDHLGPCGASEPGRKSHGNGQSSTAPTAPTAPTHGNGNGNGHGNGNGNGHGK